MIEPCVIKWGDDSPVTLRMYYYKVLKQMQFDISADKDLHFYVVSNIDVEAAKQIRDRLNDFIKEVEGEPVPTVNPPEPK